MIIIRAMNELLSAKERKECVDAYKQVWVDFWYRMPKVAKKTWYHKYHIEAPLWGITVRINSDSMFKCKKNWVSSDVLQVNDFLLQLPLFCNNQLFTKLSLSFDYIWSIICHSRVSSLMNGLVNGGFPTVNSPRVEHLKSHSLWCTHVTECWSVYALLSMLELMIQRLKLDSQESE